MTTLRQFKRCAAVAVTVYAMLAPAVAYAQSASLDLGEGSLSARAIQLVMLLTVLSIAPGILMTVTSFTRIVVVLSLLRNGLGAPGVPPNPVIISLALFLSFFVMAPTFDVAWQQGVKPWQAGQITEDVAYDRIADPFRRFMLAHTREVDLKLFADMAPARVTSSTATATATAAPSTQASNTNATPAPSATTAGATSPAPPANAARTPAAVPLSTIIPAFMISELRRSFEIGFLLLLPFLIIDMAVAAVLMALGMMMLPPPTIALPMKIIFFVLVDGWALVAGSLVKSFGSN